MNIGSQYQAEVPEMLSDRSQLLRQEDKETLLWTPSVAEDLSEEEGELFSMVILITRYAFLLELLKPSL